MIKFKISIIVLGTVFLTSAFGQGDQALISNPKIRFDGSDYRFVADVKNISSVRLKGGTCVTLFDKDNFKIEDGFSDYINFAPGASESTAGKVLLESNVSSQVTSVKFYFAAARCASGAGNALSNIVTVNIK